MRQVLGVLMFVCRIAIEGYDIDADVEARIPKERVCCCRTFIGTEKDNITYDISGTIKCTEDGYVLA